MGPGKYVPDRSEGISRIEDLPAAMVERRRRVYRRRRCPRCGRGCGLHSLGSRLLHDVGDLRNGRPRDLSVVYSKHRCTACRRGFVADMADLAPPKSSYTLRVVSLAVRLVVEDGLPYRIASWHLWRDHRVFVPFATLQNWIEAAGEKIGRPRRGRLP
jgi:hypothetical protein